MWRGAVVLLCAGVALVAAGRSPHADKVEALYKEFQARHARISDDVFEDAKLDVAGLVRKYNYPLEEHSVTTSDGYILGMHRIPHGRDRNNVPGPRPVVFLMHGLFTSSADWVVVGPGTAFGYYLAEEGFDVWMGNARGNYYSRKHVRLNPDSSINTNFWKFSWHEIGHFDLPAMIDYVLEHTGRDKLHYVGHSQGTTSFFVFGATRPEYNDKIISMHAFAPVAYMANNESTFLGMIARFANNIELIIRFLGNGELIPNSDVFTWAGKEFCMDDATFQPLCSNLIFLVGGMNPEQHNATLLPVKLGHTPAGASARQLVHYAQGIVDKGFRHYDHGSALANWREYRSFTPPAYDLSRITAPVFLHYSTNDHFAHVDDVDRLFRELSRPVGKFRVQLESFTHLDFTWGIDAMTLLYVRTVNLLKAMDAQGFVSEDLLKQ